MKKKNVFFYAGVLSVAMLVGCGASTSNETSTPVTQEVTEIPEAEDTTIENVEKDNSTEVINEENTTEENTSEEITSEENTSEEITSEEMEIQEEQEEITDANVDAQTAFSSLMTEIYEVKNDSASAETVAENLKNYAFTYGAPSSSSVFESLANDWFLAIEETEGSDVRSEFSECFNTVTSTAKEMDEALEYDAAYTNVVNGILGAIGE